LATTVFTDSQNAQNTTLTVTDTATGDPVGPALTVLGDATSSPAQFLTADGSRALLTTAVYGFDQVNGNFNTWVRVVDTATGTAVNTVVVPGYPNGSPFVTADGSRAVVTTFVDSWTSGKTSTRIAVVDTATGTQTGATITLSGRPLSTTPIQPGSGIVVTRSDTGLAAVIDTRSGASLTIPVAFPFGLDLSPLAPAIFIADVLLGWFVVVPVVTAVSLVQEALHSIASAIGLPV
jgi:hypothetical protein